MEKKPMSPLVAGLLIALAVILVTMLVSVVTAGGIGPSGGWITYLVIIIGLVLFINLFGKSNNHQLKFGELFSYGFKATTMVVLLNVIYLLALAYTVPEIKQAALDATREMFEKEKNYDEKEFNTAMDMVSKYFWVFLIGTSMFFLVVFGCIGSLIGAAITKKQPKNPFEQTYN